MYAHKTKLGIFLRPGIASLSTKSHYFFGKNTQDCCSTHQRLSLGWHNQLLNCFQNNGFNIFMLIFKNVNLKCVFEVENNNS